MNRAPVLAGLALLSACAVLVGVSGGPGSSPAEVPGALAVTLVHSQPVAFSTRAIELGATRLAALPVASPIRFGTTTGRIRLVPAPAAIVRVTSSKLIRIGFRTIKIADSSLLVGHTSVRQSGHPGVTRLVYVSTVRGKKLLSIKLVRKTVVTKVRNLIIHVGTRHVYRYHSPSHFPAVPAAVAALNWHRLAMCEAGGRIHAVTRGLYFGEYQFLVSTWLSFGGRGLPTDASGAEQTYRAELLYERSGSSPWPYCSRYL